MDIFDKKFKRIKMPTPRGKPADATLKDFHTKIPDKVLSKFNQAIGESGEKIQTVIKNFMKEYSDKILNREGSVK